MRSVHFLLDLLERSSKRVLRAAGDPRRLLSVAAATLVFLAGDPAGQIAYAHDQPEKSFVASWAVGHINPLPANVAQYSNQTLREIVRTSVGGDDVRVRITNTFGTETLVIGAAHIAVSSSGSKIVPGTDRALTFSGRTSVSIPPGAPVLSDPVRLDVKPLSDLAVSIYLPNPTKAETSTFIQGNSYVSLTSGNHVAAEDLPGASPVAAWPFLSGVNERCRFRRPDPQSCLSRSGQASGGGGERRAAHSRPAWGGGSRLRLDATPAGRKLLPPPQPSARPAP